jgi:hypothetical protein
MPGFIGTVMRTENRMIKGSGWNPLNMFKQKGINFSASAQQLKHSNKQQSLFNS